MADYFTKASFGFTCSNAELAILEETFLAAANLVDGVEPDPPSPEFLAIFPPLDPKDVWSGLRTLFTAPDFPVLGAELSGGNSLEQPHLCTAVIFGMTDFQPNAVASLVQRCCQARLAEGPIGFTWAWTCSRPRIGEIGGGWCAIFADRIDSGTSHDALAAALSGRSPHARSRPRRGRPVRQLVCAHSSPIKGNTP